MKNKIIDLNNHLFLQLERLNDENLSDEDLQKEIGRSKAITSVSREIISSSATVLKALELKAEYQGLAENDLPQLLNWKTQ